MQNGRLEAGEGGPRRESSDSRFKELYSLNIFTR